MRLRWTGSMTAMLTVLACAPAAAQECALPGMGADSAVVPERKPDVLIVATVAAAELRFGSDPQARLRVNGCELPAAAYVTERTNLPDPVQPGVTYRGVRVGVEIRTWLNVECIAALAAADPALCAPVQVQTNVTQPPAGQTAPANPPGR
ncbi:hypothetical protein [Longimicrobium sp.]|uniref:hypothetical protein n=1 Tax=Longimicrobium sp. TaxID=2029185 RepID=UPI003B3B75C4